MTPAGTKAAALTRAMIAGGERPIFLDASGRRARRVRWLGRGVAALMPAWLLAVLVGALTPLNLPALPVKVASAAGARAGAGHRPAAVASSGHAAPVRSAPAPAAVASAAKGAGGGGAGRPRATVEVASVRSRGGAVGRGAAPDRRLLHRS